MFDYVVSKLVKKYNINNFNTFFVFGENNEISLIKKFHRFVYENIVIKTSEKERYLMAFYQIQKNLKALKRLVFIWRLNKAKQSTITTDLLMNDIGSFPESQVVKIYQLGVIYTFRISDIINLWKVALTSSVTMMPFPKVPKNPYLNIDFHLGHLIKFYIAIRFKSNFMVPNIIQEFINCSMNLNKFRFKCFPQLMDYAIRHHVEHSEISILYYDCVSMVANYSHKINGRTMLPEICYAKKKQAVAVLKPVLLKYLLATRSCNPKIKYLYKPLILDELKNIFLQHRFLGRRQLRVPRRSARNRGEDIFSQSNTILYRSTYRFQNSGDESLNNPNGEILTDSDDEEVFSADLSLDLHPHLYSEYRLPYGNGHDNVHSDDDDEMLTDDSDENDPLNQVD